MAALDGSAVNVALLGGLHPTSPAGHIVVCLALTGMGAGLFTSLNNSAIMGSVPRNRQGVAGAILRTARTIGFASGVALAGLIYLASLGTPDGMETPGAIAQAVRMGMRATAAVAIAGADCSASRGPLLKTPTT